MSALLVEALKRARAARAEACDLLIAASAATALIEDTRQIELDLCELLATEPLDVRAIQ